MNTADVTAIVSKLHKLKYLDVSGCKAITADVVDVLTSCVAARVGALQHVNMMWVNCVDASLAQRLADTVPGLVVLDYFGDKACSSVSRGEAACP